MVRNIGEELQKRWNQTIVIGNKAGASGSRSTGLARARLSQLTARQGRP